MPIAYNESTGEALRLGDDGQWVPTHIAENPQTGERLAFSGQGWEPVKFAMKPKAESGATWGPVQSAAHGFWQGLGDEIMAGTAAAKESLTGGLPFDKAYDQALSMYRGARDDYRGAHPVASFATEGAGGMASALAGGAALKAVGVAAPIATTTAGRVAQNAGLGAGFGAVYGFNEGEGGLASRAAEGGKGAALGGLVGAALPAAGGAVGRVISPVRAKLGQEEARLAAIAANEGIDLTPAQLTGSRPLKTLESVFESLPLTSEPQKAVRQVQAAQFNKAVLKRAGIDADNAAPEVIDGAFNRLGTKFNDLAARTAVHIDDDFYKAIDGAAHDYGRRLPTDVAPVFRSYMDDIAAMQAAGAQPGTTATIIDGQAFQKVYSDLRRTARQAKNRPDLQHALNNLADAFDDAMERTGRNAQNLPAAPGTATPNANPAAEWAEARRQYRNLLAIDKAMSNSTAGATAGNITPTALSQAIRQQGGYARGRGDLNDLARVGTAFIRDGIPNSGTAERTFMQNLLTGGAFAGAGAGLTVNPVATVATGALALGGPRLGQMAYNSPLGGRYLANSALDNLAAAETRRAIARQAAAGGGLLGVIAAEHRGD